MKADDSGDVCVENVDNEQTPNSEFLKLCTVDSTNVMMETSASVSQPDNGSVCGNDANLHTTDDKRCTTPCSTASAEQNCYVDQKCSNTDVNTAAVCESVDRDRTEAHSSSSRVELEPTVSLAHGSEECRSVDAVQDAGLQSRQSELSNDETSTHQSAVDMSPTLMSEVTIDHRNCTCHLCVSRIDIVYRCTNKKIP